MYRRTSMIITGVSLILSIGLLSGCGVADRQPDSVSYVNSKADLTKSGRHPQFTARVLYLMDANGYVVPQMLGLPNTKSSVRQVLNYLVDDGPVANALPNGFRATLPSGTEILNVLNDQRGNLTVNFSKELLDTPVSNQNRAVQSIVWTLTQFQSVKTVTITVEGKQLDKWPAVQNASGRMLTRADGINQVAGDVADLTGSEPVTVYYMAANKGKTYDVPVTVRADGRTDQVTTMVHALIHEPATSNLISPMNPDSQLMSKPKIENGTVFLHFNDAIYDNKKAKTINDQVLRSLVLTLTEDPAIQKVSIQVGQSTKITLESGRILSGPVSREMVDATGL
ncbi:GerMN domain-containing protein [Sporolactobacillus kofuensis]|uniref:GerMN domain-containing protein n=1 Tax=Sporolactobacillus kofuensis TaxID=269672 RepID=A0ABW1WAI3_9BACL|nr:GerMN domain-containing protein [Sporolactobacillus kofuensis]MCO7175992.1 GerMN domain-containing protein [Sporolactobacillus kofuensis]